MFVTNMKATPKTMFPSLITNLLVIMMLLYGIAIPMPASGTENDAGQAGKTRPLNVLFIMADDCTFSDLGIYGGQAQTPHLSGLVKEGMLFRRCFQSAPMCSPTRHSLYTGLYPVRSGAHPNHTFVREGVRSVAHYFKEAGYRVALSGKSHVNPRKAFPFEYSNARGKREVQGIRIWMRSIASSRSARIMPRLLPFLLVPTNPIHLMTEGMFQPTQLKI